MLEANMKKQLLSPDDFQSKSAMGKRSNSKVQTGDQASVFGGPLTMQGGLLPTNPKKSNDVKLAPLNLNSDVHQKKLKKRIQLKNLIITKFRNKYCISIDYSNTLNDYIQNEIDDLFCQDTFDERDLVAVDRKVRNQVLEIKKALAVRAIKKDPKNSDADSKQATLATARQLAGQSRLNEEPTMGSIAQKSHILLSNTHNSHTIADTFTKNAQTTKSNRRSFNNYIDDRKSSVVADDIFSVTSKQRGMSQKVIENNRLASNFVTKRLIGGHQSSQSPPQRDAKTAFSGQGSQFGSITGGATMYIKARQDDYWNKIANYNRKIYDLELEEAAQKKLKDQQDLRDLLANQINAQKASNDNKNEKDRKFMNWQLQKAEEAMAAERQKMQDKKKQMQMINQERTEHQKKIIEEWNKERQNLTDYQLETLKLNKEKQEMENKNKLDAFNARKTNAMTNIERYKKLKVDSQQAREAEKRKFSPINSIELKKSIEQKKLALEMEKDFAPGMSNDMGSRMGGSNPGDMEVASRKSYQNSLMYNTLKSPLPLYNDIFTEVFTQKQHPAYIRQERASKRAEIIGKKFSNVWAVGDAEMDKKIADEFERRTLENAKFLDMKRKKQLQLAKTTLEHQQKQIDEKRNILDSDKKKERDEYIKDKKQLEQIDKKLSLEEKKRLETLNKNRVDLMNQMEEQQIKNLNEDLMNAMDYKLNRKMIGNLTNLVVLPKDKRKPF